MRTHAEILSPRLFLISLFCIATSLFFKYHLMALIAIWIGIYLYTQKADHARSLHYSYITLFLGILALVYSFL
ncbi:MAG: hypothetical protein V1836_01230 [Candidatus Aenigmatarchaeota archaeon]